MAAPVKRILRNVFLRMRGRVKRALLPADAVEFLWWEGRNWGDALNAYIVRRLSGKPARGIDFDAEYPFLPTGPQSRPQYLVIGSTLAFAQANTVVWGAGFRYSGETVRAAPREVPAVRGPLSHRMLQDQGIRCKPVYGDPALLMPRLYQPTTGRKFELGVIPHYRDFNSPLLEPFRKSQNVKIIDIESSTLSFVDQVSECAAIASSSLHGMILADAYRIPSVWLEFSKGTHRKSIKFQDYMESVGRPLQDPIIVNSETTVQSVEKSFRPYCVTFDDAQLLSSCPFLDSTALSLSATVSTAH